MRGEKGRRRTSQDSDDWKTKMGVEFSGLAGRKDFIVGIAIGVSFVVVAMIIAFVVFG